MVALALALAIGATGAGDTLLARAESLLVAGQLSAARRIAERLQDLRPDDPRVLVLLGRIRLAWPVVGRFQAESLFSQAARLAPGDPEPLYYLGQVGLALGGDDGEQIARRGLVPALALNPEYRDAWALWLRLYRGDRERRDMIAALTRHEGGWNADYWRAQLLLESGRSEEAAGVLEDVIRRRSDPGPRAWLARALFQTGRDSAGAAAYEAALSHAAEDTGQVLWRQIRGIATPAERLVYEATPPESRAAFFRLFWAQRRPDLRSSVNQRIAEHFLRLQRAQHFFALLHPNSRYFHSALFRALSGGVGRLPGPGIGEAYVRAREAQCDARVLGARDAPEQAGLAARVENPQGETLNLEDGLDDRGRIYLRHGKPDARFTGGSLDSETWCYFRGGSVLRVSFLRRTGGWQVSGDMVVTPMASGEAASAVELLATDRSDEKSDLIFQFWPAVFRASDRRLTELIVVPDSLWALAALVDGEGREVARDSAEGRALHLRAPPGRYVLLLDAERAGRRGRFRGVFPLADFGGEEPVVSSILVAEDPTPPERDSLAAAAPRRLVLPAGRPLRFYAELYNMGRFDGTSRYEAEYRFERTDRSIIPGRRQRVTTITVQREHPFEPRIVESLVIDPGRLPSGHYRLQLEVADQLRGTRTRSAVIEFTLR